MARKVTEIKIFISSPGDLDTWHRRARSQVEIYNNTHGDKAKHRFKIISQADLMSDIGSSPQAVVDEQVAGYDAYLGLMWTRFGSPTPDAGSGTEHEFNVAVELREQHGESLPIVSFLFCEKRPNMATLDGDQFEKLKVFKKKVGATKLLHRKFKSQAEFDLALMQIMAELPKRLQEARRKKTTNPPFSENVMKAAKDALGDL